MRQTFATTLLAAGLTALSLIPAAAQRAPSSAAPEAATGWRAEQLATARKHMVAAANPLAAEAGRTILRAGGSAVDAAIAVQLVLNLVEPQSSGLGGGAFLLHWNAVSKRMTSYDGRETAPAAARADQFLDPAGRPIPFHRAVPSGAAIGVPGTIAMLELAHRRHGRLPWARLFESAIKVAREGFPVSARLNLLLRWMGADAFSTDARRYFFDGNLDPWPIGHKLANPAFARTLETIARDGAQALYSGVIADEIVDAVARAPRPGGGMTRADLSAYKAKERQPVCVPYRGYRVCGMGPPSSGALTVGQVLRLIEPFALGRRPRDAINPFAMHVIAEAQKLAYADRGRYIADPDHVEVPDTLTDAGYLESRRRFIDPWSAMPRATPGAPPHRQAMHHGDDATVEASGTSHVSIVDRDGNAVALTTTIEAGFGSRQWAAGFLLNNEMTDFSFRPVDGQGRPIANAIASGKRPRSSMAPTIVLDGDDRVVAVLGSPGGSRIIMYVVKALVGLIDWKLDAQAATALVNFGSRGIGLELEATTADAYGAMFRPWAWGSTLWQALRLKPLGHTIHFDLMTSGLHIIRRRPDGTLEGGADPRREGVALGD